MERIIKADPLTTTREVAEELNVTHSMIIWHLKQTGKVKKLGKWVPHELTKIQNIVVLKCQLLLFYATNNNEWFLDQIVTCDKKWIIYGHQQWPIQWLDWEEAPKYFPKPNSNLYQKRSCRCLAVCCLSDPLQLSESWRNCYIWEVCSANQWDADENHSFSTEWAQFSTTTLDCRSHNHFKNWMNWAMKFCFIRHIHLTARQPTTTSSSI